MNKLIVRYHDGFWWAYDEEFDSDTGPYSTYKQAQDWIDQIKPTDPYQKLGYANREAYLKSLAIKFKVDKTSVISLAKLLGLSEDFDGLVSDLEDFSQFI